ncbi:MAG: hypothetical protein RIQ81_2696 [Pseudomonadota bacterium]
MARNLFRNLGLFLVAGIAIFSAACSRGEEETAAIKQTLGVAGHVFGESTTADGARTFFIILWTRVEDAEIKAVRIDNVPIAKGASIFGDANNYKTGRLDSTLTNIELGKSRSDYESTLKSWAGEPFFNMTGHADAFGMGTGKHQFTVDVSWQGQTITYDPWAATR